MQSDIHTNTDNIIIKFQICTKMQRAHYVASGCPDCLVQTTFAGIDVFQWSVEFQLHIEMNTIWKHGEYIVA